MLWASCGISEVLWIIGPTPGFAKYGYIVTERGRRSGFSHIQFLDHCSYIETSRFSSSMQLICLLFLASMLNILQFVLTEANCAMPSPIDAHLYDVYRLE